MFELLSKKFGSIFSRFKKRHISQADITQVVQQIEQALIEADVPFKLVQSFLEELKSDVVGQKLVGSAKPAEQFLSIVHKRLVTFLGGSATPFSFKSPSITLVMGLQGSGKTTTIGKLARKVVQDAQQKKGACRVLLASVDFYRPAAVDQLEQVARQAGVSFYRAQNTDPVAAAKEIVAHYQANRFTMLFLDTAGRMHIDNALLTQLQEIDQVVVPQHKLLVLDAMTGQESLNVAQAFAQAIGFDAGILSKMDSDTRGGAAFSFSYALSKPIAYLGTGEKGEDLSLFYPERIADRILDQGDMRTLIEQAEQKIKQDEQKQIEASFKADRFTLEDFANQMAMMNRLGSLGQLMNYMPGMGAMNIPKEKLEEGEREMKKFRVILSSMTRKERLKPSLLDNSRRARIAKGAGVGASDVANLLRRFDQAQQYVKLMKKMGPFKGLFK